MSNNYTPSEQAQHRAELAAALRSGKYEQEDSVLRAAHAGTQGRHCCLGVACDISGLGEWQTSSDATPDGADVMVYFVSREDHETGIMPLAVCEYFGISSVGELTADGRARLIDDGDPSLSGLNDDGVSFAEIAGIIEADLIQVVA